MACAQRLPRWRRLSFARRQLGRRLYYTYLHDDQTAGLVAPAGGQLFATQTHPGTVEFAGRAFADAGISYNVYDLEIGRTTAVSQHMTVRPFGGLRFADINQNFTTVYDGVDANRDIIGSRIKFDGAGLRAGARRIGKCWITSASLAGPPAR